MGVIERYWAAMESRAWDDLAALLADGVVYELPQTRERVTGRDAYVRFNREYPGDWHLTVDRVHSDATGGASWATFTVGGETMPAVTFFRFGADGSVTHVTDFWPVPYDPPPGREHLVERY